MYNNGTDQTLQMRRLVFAFVVFKSGRQDFLRQGLIINNWTIDGINSSAKKKFICSFLLLLLLLLLLFSLTCYHSLTERKDI